MVGRKCCFAHRNLTWHPRRSILLLRLELLSFDDFLRLRCRTPVRLYCGVRDHALRSTRSVFNQNWIAHIVLLYNSNENRRRTEECSDNLVCRHGAVHAAHSVIYHVHARHLHRCLILCVLLCSPSLGRKCCHYGEIPPGYSSFRRRKGISKPFKARVGLVAFEMPRMVPSFCNCVFSCHCLVLAGRGCRRRTLWRLLVYAHASLCLVSFQVCSRAFCGHFICVVPPFTWAYYSSCLSHPSPGGSSNRV